MKRSLLCLFFVSLPLGAQEFNPQQVVSPFPAITEVPIVSAEEADDYVGSAELVLGVHVGNEARAYPINQLTSPTREIINDSLDGQSIAATW